MTQQNRILTLIDFSEYSGILIGFSVELAKTLGAGITLVHQVPRLLPALATAENKAHILTLEKQEALEKMRTLTSGYALSDNDFIISEKSVIKLLKELQRADCFDWIVTGMKGTSALKQVFVGSTTLKIIDQHDAVTISIPLRNTDSLPEKLIVAVSCKYPLNLILFNRVLAGLSTVDPGD